MIVKEILRDVHGTIRNFDWEKDYNDTNTWLMDLGYDSIALELRGAYGVWLRRTQDGIVPGQPPAQHATGSPRAITVYIAQEHIDVLKRVGGSVSAGIRILAEARNRSYNK